MLYSDGIWQEAWKLTKLASEVWLIFEFGWRNDTKFGVCGSNYKQPCDSRDKPHGCNGS